MSVYRAATQGIAGADLRLSSRIYMGLLPNFAQRVLLSTLLATGLAYLGLALLCGHVVAVLIFALASMLIVGQLLVYKMNCGRVASLLDAKQYLVLLSFTAFFVVGRDGLAPPAARLLSLYALVSVVFYIGYVGVHFAGLMPPRFTQAPLLNDAERGNRFFAYAGAPVHSWHVSLVRVRARASGEHLVLLAMCALANKLTLSRVCLACLAAVTAMNILRASHVVIRAMSVGTLCFLSSVLLYGLVDIRWNSLFALSGNDAFGIGRGFEYQIAQDLLARSPILGLALSSSPEQPELLMGISFFSTGDLGMIGVILDFGLVGLGLFPALFWLACTRPRMLAGDLGDVLHLTGCTLPMYGYIAPILFAPGGTFYFAAILGIWLVWRPGGQSSRGGLLPRCSRNLRQGFERRNCNSLVPPRQADDMISPRLPLATARLYFLPDRGMLGADRRLGRAGRSLEREAT